MPSSDVTTATRPKARRHRPPPPRVWGLRPGDLIAAVALNAVIIIGMWLRHGGLNGLGGPSGILTAIGQITALLGTYSVLIQLVLMSRSPYLEQLFGMDRLAHWHRTLGYVSMYLILGHVAFTTVGYAMGDHSSLLRETKVLLTRYPDMLMAYVGTALLILVVVTSVRIARRKLKYETWHMIHFYSYLAIALSFAHQLAVGSDFTNDPLARGYWIFLYAIVITAMLAFRVGHPLALSLRHRLRVANVVTEAPGVLSVYVTGRDLSQLRSRAGQYFKWRFLSGKGGWPAHPYSLSAAPNGEFLRLTVKEVGEGSRRIRNLRKGTRVAIEGPYGTFTALRRRRKNALLIAGGIGIAPIRALLEEMPTKRGNIVLLYRASTWDEIIFKNEIDQLARARGCTVHYLVGRRGTSDLLEDPLSPRRILDTVPDVRERDVFVCGPAGMMSEVHDSLRVLKLDDAQIHYERFALL